MSVDPRIRKSIIDFAQRRVHDIRAANRQALDASYDGLERRNHWNRCDYDWYLSLIETGFGVESRVIEVASQNPGDPLPFPGAVTYPWPPEFRVILTTTTNRRTLWLIAFRNGEPKVVLPAFDGRVADGVATGEVLPFKPKTIEDAGADTLVTFHPDDFVRQLADATSLELSFWASRWQCETIRALAIDCAPWHGGIALSLLTQNEDFDEHNKWAIGDWRLHDFTASAGAEGWPAVKELARLMNRYYLGGANADVDRSAQDRAKVVFECAARALKSEEVAKALSLYSLSDDFEFGVFDPDDSTSKNYCR